MMRSIRTIRPRSISHAFNRKPGGSDFHRSDVGGIRSLSVASRAKSRWVNGCQIYDFVARKFATPYVNQFEKGDHIGPSGCESERVSVLGALGVSLPNANLRRALRSGHYVLNRFRINVLILELVLTICAKMIADEFAPFCNSRP